MSASDSDLRPGPLDVGEFAEQLQARVITPGDSPTVHGYDVENDIARHYGYSEYLLLCLTGELPTPARARAFDIAMTFLGPLSVAHAPTHAAVLSRLCGARTSGTIGVASIGLSEQARVLIAEHRELIVWLARPEGELPAEYRADADDPSVARLADVLGGVGVAIPALSHRPTRDAALVATLWTIGLKRAAQLEAALVLARLPGTLAEAFAEHATNFAHYPVNLPRFEYRDPERRVMKTAISSPEESTCDSPR
jgi:hypothetical protein